MKLSVILAHPDKRSLNRAIADRVVAALDNNGHRVAFHDLYSEKFNPILPAEEIPREAVLPDPLTDQCGEIASADGIIIVHPNWWGQPPAILKGWIDRVFRPDVAYKFLEEDSGEGVPIGLLNARAALVFNTANTPQARELAVFGDPLETLWRNCIFDLCGVKTFYRRTFAFVVTSTADERAGWLQEVEDTVNRFFPPD